MSFLSPFAFLLAAILPIIIAMYLLKLRRIEQTVASTYLWQRMVRDVEANSPWQRLRRNLLLYLQLLVAILLILALARPFSWAEGPAGAAVVLILDHSMSMAATDVTPNRLEFAKAEIERWVDSLPDDMSVTLIAAGKTPDVVVASTQDRRLLKLGLHEIILTPSQSNLQAALALATAIANQHPEVTIQLYSDFAGAGQTLPETDQTPLINTVQIGLHDKNQAISAVTVEFDRGSDIEEERRGFVQVTNFSDELAERRVSISSVWADGHDDIAPQEQLVNVFDVTLSPRATESIVLANLPSDTEILHAKFTEPDVLPRDDQAWALAQNHTSAEVLLVSAGNRFLETGLALLPDVAVTVQRPEDFERSIERSAQSASGTSRHAITIFDSFVPITATLPASNLFFIGPTRSTYLFEITGVIEQPRLQKASDSDPRLNNLALDEVNVLSAAQISQPDWATPLLVDASSQLPILMAGTHSGIEQSERRIAVLGFDIRNSDLPLQVAFPLLLANLIDWLGGGNVSLPLLVDAGATLSFLPPPVVKTVEIEMPDGSTARLDPEAGRISFAETEQPGIYTVHWEDEMQAQFVVNGYSAIESEIRPGTLFDEVSSSVQIVNDDVAAVQKTPREWWRIVALLALVVLMAEWLVYHRGTVTYFVGW